MSNPPQRPHLKSMDQLFKAEEIVIAAAEVANSGKLSPKELVSFGMSVTAILDVAARNQEKK